MRCVSVLLLATLPLVAQHAPAPAAKVLAPQPAAQPGERHRPDTRLPPDAAFDHLLAAAIAATATPKAPLPRPAGAGRRLFVVVCAPEAAKAPHELFAVAAKDLLVLSSPGPCVRLEEIAAIERSATRDEVSLGVVLVPEPVQAATPALLSPAQTALQRRLAADPRTQAENQIAAILALSPVLTDLVAKDRFQLVSAVLRPDGTLVWWAPWRTDPTRRPPEPRAAHVPPGHHK